MIRFFRLCVCILSANLLLGATAFADNLNQIQQKIQGQQAKIDEQKKKRASLQSTLKNQEVEMGRVSDNLKKTQLSLNEIRQAIVHTEQEIKRLEKQEKEQKERLKEQLNSAYRAGIHPSVIERLLSEQAKNADRISAYYEHINQIRIDAINELRQTQKELKARRDELKGQQKGQQTQLNEQKKQEKELQKVKNERENTIRSLDRSLAREESRLEALKENEAALRNQLTKASRKAEQQEKREIAKLEQQKKHQEQRKPTEQELQKVRAGSGLGSAKYAMPVEGKILHKFGSTQMGELKWSGIVIQAKLGTPVKAIADGRVLMSSWLEGYGQMVAIEHGNNDLSLYGYNQSLAVREGMRVKKGQVIATVGNSGGQNRTALYFEIRRKGQPMNPMRWVQ